MPTPSIEEFWRLTLASGLLDPQQIVSLQAEFQSVRGAAAIGNARTLCEWLIDRRALSRFQCDVLLLGQAGPLQFGDYVVWDRIGSGRLRGLFRGLHRPTGERVLMKFLSGPASADLQRSSALADAAGRSIQLNTTHLAAFVELLDVDPYRALVVQNLSGNSAAELLRSEGRMAPAAACEAAHAAATGLAEMHRRGITHGDIRPENIWHEKSNPGAERACCYLLGFPLSRDPLGPAAGLDLWTVDYAAPELAEQNAPTPLTDVYALGCTLYELLTGQPPFGSGPLQRPIAEKIARHATEPIVPIDQSGTMPDGLNRVVSFMMAKNPAVRLPDMEAVIAALAPYVTEATASAEATQGNGYFKLRQFCQQRPARKADAVPSPSSLAAAPPVSAAATGLAAAPLNPPTISHDLPKAAQWVGPPMPATIAPAMSKEWQPSKEVSQAKAPNPFSLGPQLGPTPAMDFPAELPKPTRRSGNLWPVLGVAGVMGLIVAVLVGLTMNRGPRDTTVTPPKHPDETAAVTQSTVDTPAATETTGPRGVPDDGTSLWVSPTQGAAPQVRYIAPGTQILAVLRPHALLGSPQGLETIDSMGPAGAWLLAWIETQTGVKPDAIDRLDIALYEAFGPQPAVSLVAYVNERPAEAALVAAWRNPTPAEKEGHRYFLQGDLCRYLPPGQKNVIVVAPRPQMDDILASGAAPATLDANMQLLVDGGDVSRHINVFLLPIYARAARDTLYPGTLGPLREGLDWFLGPSEDVQAVAASFELSEPMFAELRIYPARSKKPRVMARDFHTRIDEFSNRIQEQLVSLTVSSYSRPTLAQLPFMVQALAQHTRHGAEGRIAVVRSYLPGNAAANLALATDLLLLESAGTVPTTGAPSKPVAKTIWDRLKQPVSISFERDSLENALKQLSTEMGAKIEILGNDLKLDGITKNQPLGLDMKNKPAEEVLQQIMLQANPDRTVKKLSDDIQKLVYVVKPASAGGEDSILVTTRAKSAERGDLPAIFQKK